MTDELSTLAAKLAAEKPVTERKLGRPRNYRAMGDEKLKRVYHELLSGGDAAKRAEGTTSGVAVDVKVCHDLMWERGLTP